MRVVIEFYRTRPQDEAHAMVGRETAEVADRDEAIKVAQELARTLNMPQCPDVMTITGAAGAMLYSGVIDAETGSERRQ